MSENLKLIEGSFSPAEAADVLLSLLNDKIKFHTVKSLNLRQGESETAGNVPERILKLKLAKKRVEELVLEAHRNGKQLEINSIIQIKLIDKTDI